MSDLISRQAAIDALQKEINKAKPPFDDVIGSIRCGVRLARNIIEDLPSAQPEQRWIPCSERLPIKEFEEGFKNGTVYDLYPCLVSRTAKHSPVNPDRIYVAKHYFDGEDFLNVDAQVVTDKVIAWMPLPEPYRAKRRTDE